MKNSKTPLIAFALSFAIFSCTNNEPSSPNPTTSAVATSYEVIAASALPTTISSYITSKYVGALTTQVNLNSNGSYVTYVSLLAGTKLKTTSSAKTSNVVAKLNFSVKGDFVSAQTETPIATADLLPAITNYITTTYVGATITAAHLESDGGFDVIITAADSSKSKLNFAADGTFVSISTFKANGNHKHKHDKNQIPVAIADLVSNIKSYITSNYDGATITSAHKESDNSFDVFITTAAGAHLNLNFSTTGEFVSVSSNGNNHSNHETQVALADLLADITTYISTNYAGATITSAQKDWNGGFEVHIISATGVRLELNFNETGAFVVGSDSNNDHASSMVSVIIKDLIATIKDYITTNYAGATITAAHVESDGSYDILITTVDKVELKLNFSSTGEFVNVKSNN